MSSTAVVLLCREPHPVWLDFLDTSSHYDVYVMIDWDTSPPTSYPSLQFLSVPDQECDEAGFKNLCSPCIWKKKDYPLTAWDKAMYYFCRRVPHHGYQHFWFVEEDVFFHSEETLRKVDTQFPDSDLLTQEYQRGINQDGKRKDWMWNLIVPTIKDIDPPYYSTMICAARMSDTLLKKVGEYVCQHHEMFFLEAFFPTLAHTHGLRHDEPPAMHTIIYRREWQDGELSETMSFYHPMKDILRHSQLRQRPTKDAVFLLCRTPHPVWLDFLSTFVHYQVYILIDNPESESENDRYPNLRFLQIPDHACSDAGFHHLLFQNMRDAHKTFPTTAWDKAMYYACGDGYGDHERIWVLEDDVFLYEEETLRSIDRRFPEEDLLTRSLTGAGGINPDGQRNDWFWKQLVPQMKGFDPPFYSTMVCAMRVSTRYLEAVRDYVEQHGTLFFLEAFFPTLGRKRNVVYGFPWELDSIVFRREWKTCEIQTTSLYHPIKDILRHAELRGRCTVNIEGDDSVDNGHRKKSDEDLSVESNQV